MKKRMFTILLALVLIFPAFTPTVFADDASVVIDYGDAESFEQALNRGENLEGKTVQFKALELHPQSAFGYNVWAGEHLNFISDSHPSINQDDVVTVRALKIRSVLKSWFITYEKLSNAVVGDTTIFYNRPEVRTEFNIAVTLNGDSLEFDVPPQVISNRTMVPLRKIFETMGASVDWNNDTRTVTATKGNDLVIATIGDKNVFINGDTKTLDVPPMIVETRTLVPIRFVAEAFGANVLWDGSTRTVVITTKWDGTGVIPCYKEYPAIPDFGRIVGLPDLDSNATKTAYSYDASQLSSDDIHNYLSVLQSLGYQIGIEDSIIACEKDGVYVDIWQPDDTIDVVITMP